MNQNENQEEKTKIVGLNLDTQYLTLYREDGSTIVIPQGDSRVQRIVDEATGPITSQGYAWVDTGTPDPDHNPYAEFEQKSSGMVKFFRVATKWLKGIVTGETESNEGHTYVKPVTIGDISGSTPIPAEIATTGDIEPKLGNALSEIMANAKPVSDPDYRQADTDETSDTMIAAVSHPVTGEPTIIPAVQNLSKQIDHAQKLGSTKGVENFLSRLATVIKERGHTVDELLQFMSRGDLPIAEDGSIIAYKVLQTVPSVKERFVDCHTKKVQQRVGSRVTQKNVDPSRRIECSQGLHIARRGYLRRFSGNIIVLVKINPEDVIAVPLGEPDKMRVAAYHILFEIPKEDHPVLRSDRPFENTRSKVLLNKALQGDHVRVIEDVVIGGASGNNVIITQREKPAELAAPIAKVTTPAETLAEDTVTQDGPKAPTVDPKVVNKTALETKQAPKGLAPVPPVPASVPDKPETRVEKAARLVRQITLASGNQQVDAARELLALKKSSKQSWEALGVPNQEEVIRLAQMEPQPISKNAPAAKATEAPKTKLLPGDSAPPLAGETRTQKARRLYVAQNWKELYAHKKAVKVSFSNLGFTALELKIIEQNKPA